MAEYHITCISQPADKSGHEHITHAGNDAWPFRRLRVQQIIRRLRHEVDVFYVEDAKGNRYYVGVIEANKDRPAYIRTHTGGMWTDHLLSLQQCQLGDNV